ncbi:MAG: hypothetical protein Q8898_14750, partial [Bacillota bacterium]|nr:hypothetical protein [Bacillota bacterium]
EFLNEHFMEMINELPAIAVSVQPDDLDCPAPIHKETAELFKKISEAAEEPADITEYGIMMWYHFCKATQKRIQNPAVYAAAIHYLAYNSTLDSQVTQKQIGERYGIAPNRISTISNDILDVLEQELEDPAPAIPSIQQRSPQAASPLAAEQELQKLMGELNQNDFKNLDEVNAFINSRLNTPQNNVKNAAQNKKEEAQDLIYQAFETNGKKRYKLAEEALQLNPNNADAYNILAEKATSLEEASHLYKTGMEAGIKDLGKAFLLKNKGHFWGLIETRPFMRAKKHYADSLIQLGKPKEAIREYEELLTLNPNDSQGVRDNLFIAYVDQGDLKNAKRLLELYKEETTQGLLNGVLLEVLQNGFTAKATTLLKKVKKQNKFVLAYLTGQNKIPKNLPEYYGWGDENEAIIYAHAHQHLWGRVDGIVEWLKK